MKYSNIVSLLQEQETLVEAELIESIKKLLTEESATTIASLPVTLGLRSTDPDRFNKLMTIIGAFVYPVEDFTWEQFIKKFGKMTMTEFIRKTKINVDQFASSLAKTFPYINKAVVKRLA